MTNSVPHGERLRSMARGRRIIYHSGRRRESIASIGSMDAFPIAETIPAGVQPRDHAPCDSGDCPAT